MKTTTTEKVKKTKKHVVVLKKCIRLTTTITTKSKKQGNNATDPGVHKNEKYILCIDLYTYILMYNSNKTIKSK